MLPASKEDAQCTLATMAGGGEPVTWPPARTKKNQRLTTSPRTRVSERAGH